MLMAAWNVSAATELDTLDLAQYKGKVIYLDFWASWCKPCRRSFPWMNEMHAKFGEDLVIIAVNVDKERTLANTFLENVPADFNLYFDAQGVWPGKTKIKGMPSSVIYDKNGDEAFRHTGFFPNKTAEYEANLNSLINNSGA
jgi:thiol-disulfide isomerase/thioredoxin